MEIFWRTGERKFLRSLELYEESQEFVLVTVLSKKKRDFFISHNKVHS